MKKKKITKNRQGLLAEKRFPSAKKEKIQLIDAHKSSQQQNPFFPKRELFELWS